MLRSLSKVASTATAAASAAVVSVSSAHAEFPIKKYRENAHSRLAKPYPGPQHIDDEYDFCQEEMYGAFVGGVPSQEEVDEATRDLQATFVQSEGYRGPNYFKRKACEDDAVADEDVASVVVKDACGDQEDSSTPTLTPSPSRGLNLQTVTSGGSQNAVARCVDLLQRDPDIQAAVVSLARDPAIWDAFVKNEKVQELLQAKNLSLPRLEGSSREESGTSKDGHENPFVVALALAKKLAFEVVDTVVDMIGNVFGFFDQKIFGGKDSDPLDRPLKACMVLTVLVLALVVFKRGG